MSGIVLKMLIADDEPAVLEYVSRAARALGHDVTSVTDGYQALEALAEDSFDLLLTDIVMPGLDGIALALKCQKDFPELMILLMSGYAAERQRAHAMEELFHAVLSKPFSMEELDEALQKAALSSQ